MDARYILAYLRPYRIHLMGALLSLGLVTAAQLAIPRYVGVMIDEVITTRSFAVLDVAAVVVLTLFLVRSLLVYAQVYLTYYLAHRAIADMRRDLFAGIQRWSVDRFVTWSSGDAISRILQDTQLVQTHLLAGVVDVLATVLMILGIVLMLFWLDWRLALLVGLVIPVVFTLARLFGREIQGIAVRAQSQVADLASAIREAFAGALVIRAFTQEEREVGRFAAGVERATQANLRIARLLATQVPVVSFLTALGLVAVLWVGGRLVAQAAMTPGELVAFLGYMALAVEPAISLVRHNAEVRQALGATSRLREVLAEQPTVTEAPDAVDLPRISGRVEFRAVSFRYANGTGPGQDVLRAVTLMVQPGERVALVGLSGAGKTTLAHLLPRFYDPTEGAILIDGTDIRGVRLRSLRRQIGFVPQETVLFRGTVRENIAYARPEASADEVVAAARAANAHAFITALPHAYDTIIGEDGAALSGGQRQRLAIARALLQDPKILILDEATSALDSESEALFQDAVERAMQDRTTITIAHRLSTVRTADRILVLDEGRIVEEGTHEELLARGGRYARLARLQWPDLFAEAPPRPPTAEPVRESLATPDP